MNEPSRSASARIPGAVWALGIVSMLMDASSELVHSLLPLFLVGVLGASATTLGIIEGVGEATAMIVKLFSGTLSDAMKRRKPLVVAGYGLAALSKPLFALATTAGMVFAARFADRIGKGIRGAPRDAIINAVTPGAMRGAAFGLRQSLDTVGAVVGPVLAVAFMLVLADNLRLVLWVAVIPAVLSVAVLIFGVREPDTAAKSGKGAFRLSALRNLPSAFWVVVSVGGVLTLARFSEAFLVLRAEGSGMGARYAPLVMVVLSVVYAAAAYPAGALSDRIGRNGLLIAGLLVLVAANLALANGTTPAFVLAGAALWGLHMGLSQGLLAAMVGDTAPPTLTGSAFGLFYLVSGLALLAASILAGMLWDAQGPAATFYAGAGITAVALAGTLFLQRVVRPR